MEGAAARGRRVEMSLHHRPLILPLPLYVPHVSIYRGKIVLWKIMTKLHSINKLGMAKREHRVSEGLMEVSQALDYKYVRYSWTLLKREQLLKAERKTECFSLRSISSPHPLYLQSLLTTRGATLGQR